ncbi:MAG: hypothetical protein GXY03_09980 [Solirubrobacterales bacterium]|nr:hypothetical protein [Solirubrobacterales bacterium]
MPLDPDDIEQIAQRVADLIGAGPGHRGRYVDAATLATELGVERHWVYAHASQLGGIRLGGGRGRLRFDLDEVRRRLAAEDRPQQEAARKRGRRRRRKPADPPDLIPYEG